MGNVRGDFFGNGTPPAAVIANKSIKYSFFESNENTQRHNVGHIAQFRIVNPPQ